MRTGNPFISSATVIVGDTATATHGAYSGIVSGYTGQWYRGTSAIALATGLTYQYQTADLGFSITYQELASNSAGFSATGTSNALGPITTVLGTLTFSQTTFTVGTAVNGPIIGATAGSTITATGLPASVTINSVARTFRYDGTGSGASGTITLTETLSVGSNSPHSSSVSYTINAVSGTLTAPVLGYPSPLASNPTTIAIHVGPDWQTGDILKLARSASVAMTSPTILTHTLTDADIAAAIAGTPLSMGLSGVTLAGTTYFQAYGNHAGADSANVSNIVTWGDTTAPTITTSATQSITETSLLAIALTGTDAGGIASWSIVGGLDQLQFQIVGSTLEWVNNGYQNYASPQNSTLDTAQPYRVTVQATDYGGNSATQAIAVSVTAIDQTPDVFTFTNVNNAALSTVYTSNTVTLSGLSPGFNIPASLSGTGFTYSKNGGAYQAPGSFTVQNGDTLTLRDTSASSNSTTNAASVTVGTYSTAWSVATPGSAAVLTTTTGNSKSQYANVSGQQFVLNNAIGANVLVRANLAASNTKFHTELTNDVNAASPAFAFGFDDGTPTLNTPGYFAAGALPGNSGINGITALVGGAGSNSISLFANGGQTTPTLTDGNWAIGDAFIWEVDSSTHVYKLYHWRTATSVATLIATTTLTSGIPGSNYAFCGGQSGDGTTTAGHSDAGTFNAGAAAWKMTPTTGYTYYA